MPEYGELLKSECVWEWKPYYLNYDRLKGWIKELESTMTDKAVEKFLEELELGLERVNHFYLAQESQAQKAFESVRDRKTPKGCDDLDSAAETNLANIALIDIQKLKLYSKQNEEGFRKIAKKFDKNIKRVAEARDFDVKLPNDSLEAHVVSLVERKPFADAEARLGRLEQAIQALEQGRHEEFEIPERVLSRQSSIGKRLSRLGGALEAPLIQKRHRGTSETLMRSTRRAVGIFKRNLPLLALGVVVAMLARADLTPILKPASYLVIWVTMVVLYFLVKQSPPDIVLMGATLFLTVCGILTQEAAWAAFSNDVVLSVAGLGVIAHAVEKTGIIDIVFGVVLGKPKSLAVAMLRLFLPAIVLNVCISNTCVMSCLLSVIDKWSQEIGYPKAFFLMPLSYLLLISGTFAIFSTSTNLIAQGLLVTHGETPFGNFDLALPALMCSAVTIAYLIIVVPFALGRFSLTGKARKEAQPAIGKRKENRYDVRVQITGRALRGQTLAASGLVAQLGGGLRDVCGCERYGVMTENVGEDMVLELDDVLWLRTNLEGVSSLFMTAGIQFVALDLSDDTASLDQTNRDLVEAVLDKESPLVGHRLGSAKKYRPEYDCPIVAYRAFNSFQGEEAQSVDSPRGIEVGATPETRLERGDHIILNCPTSFYNTFKDSSDFVVLRKIFSAEPLVSDQNMSKAYQAGACLLMLIGFVSTSTLQLLEAVFVCLSALIFLKCTTMDSCVRAVKLRTVFTIVGAFGLGKAIGQEGVANVLAEMLIFVLKPFGHRGLLVAIFASTVALGVIFHGTAVVVLMFPICSEIANSMGMPIHQTVAVLCLAVSCQMLSPISYQTNLMAYSTGGYQFADFTKVGLGLVVCIAAVTIPLCEHSFPS
mmetsp:Transcript_37076/g.94893  ORF Transcript_37076/g.94893 Transcript_37076/m.94893 type:complete len:879 (+) Transcript_37076:62-2698(+)